MDKFSDDRMIQNGEPPKKKRGRPRIHPLPAEAAEAPPKGIVCPGCGSDSHYVYRSIPAPGGMYIRQRVCQNCRRRFETKETAKG